MVSDMDLSHSTFDGLRKAIHQICGVVITSDKEYLIRNRLEGLLSQWGLVGFDELYERLQRRDSERLMTAVVDAVTTQETSFFRDSYVFDALARDVFSQLAARSVDQHRRIRILSAGVSTGQEAYSLAILAHEMTTQRTGPTAPAHGASIIAGDISTRALQTAMAGLYEPREVTRGLSIAHLQRYFEPQGGRYRVREPIRKMVEFRRLNLAEPLTVGGPFDLICCRNVMIYFDEPTRRRICHQFHQLLADDGWLLLGTAENLYGISTDFVSQRLGETLIYRKAKGLPS
jgi:chemotaxis protein methyltransferase CheR